MKILITGAAGFIGHRTSAILGNAGHHVIGIDNMLPQAHGESAEAPDGVMQLDIRTATELDEVLTGVDVVCHQSAMVGNGVSAQDMPGYASHNDYGTAILLAAMSRVGVTNLVMASSMVAYGNGRFRCEIDGEVAPSPRRESDLRAGTFDPRCPICDKLVTWVPVFEDAPFAPQTSYAASKVAQENYATAWSIIEASRCIALRYHNAYGPQMPADTPYAGVAALFRSALARGEAPQVFEDGQQMRDFVHVDDLARANLAAIERIADHPTGCTPYNICSGRPFTIGAMAELLAESAQGPPPIVTGEYRAFDVRHVVAAPDAARRGLNFEARIAPEDGIRELATAPLRRRH